MKPGRQAGSWLRKFICIVVILVICLPTGQPACPVGRVGLFTENF
ncbi:MAG TPA: hypothetical protein VFI29_23035 [Hanamia sp.]|nr:hypothetical protein [Hanamia sp.]